MPETEITQAPKAKNPVADGFTAPIPEPEEDQPVPNHINPHTLMAKGFDPDSKKMVTVSLQVLQLKHGEKKGMRLYSKIALAGGFLNPDVEVNLGSHFYPDLSLEGILDPEARAKVDAILKEV